MPDSGFLAGPCPRCGWFATFANGEPRTYSQLAALAAFDAHIADHKAGRIATPELVDDVLAEPEYIAA